jgi:indole-3-glycerol phosphate synthase
VVVGGGKRNIDVCRVGFGLRVSSRRLGCKRAEIPAKRALTLLDALFDGALEDAAQREKLKPFDAVVKEAGQQALPRSARQALSPREQIHVIAEIKRASPSKGKLSEIPDPVLLAMDYQAGGASAISVLTEQRRFGGSLEDLSQVSHHVSIPVLRKDFLKTDYQVAEARAHGADWILLILAHLSDDEAVALMATARSFGMDCLVETHTDVEVKRAVGIGAEIIGINARDLATFELNPALFGSLVHLIPEGTIRIAESAVANSQDVQRYREEGAHAVLVGEALVTRSKPQDRVREFVKA